MKRQNLPKATHEGEVNIGDIKIRCYNLDNGERVLSREGFLRAIGRTGKPKYKEDITKSEDSEVFSTPIFLSAANLKPFISNELVESSQPMLFELGKQVVYGFKAEILPSVCYVFIDAEKKKVLNRSQKQIAERCHVLIRGFATVGIIALVDEATGYQYDREKDELQRILKAYISEELLPWQKRFPDVYYKELFRLNGWDFTVHGIKRRPGVIGKWTNSLVYERLPKGVLEELKKRTPKSESGHYLAKLHQNLTLDIGEPNLTAQLNKVITLFQLSDNMEHMWQQFNKLKSREEGQMEIPFVFDEQGHTKEPVYEEMELSEFDKKLKKAIDFKANK